MPNYRVQYAFEHSDSEARPEGEKYGFGVIVVNTDKEPETPEELKEIARFIGTMRHADKTEDYKAVGIITISDTDLELDADGRDVLLQTDDTRNLIISGEVLEEDEGDDD